MKVTKITLEDNGQDFLEWYVKDGIVIDCQPFQGSAWVGCTVINDKPRKGSVLSIYQLLGETRYNLNHKVAKVETLSGKEAEEVLGYGVKWAAILGVPAATLGL